ncbi:MAG: hypothetical protein ACRDSJ_12550 [Rubrobacteraceae bacterium]
MLDTSLSRGEFLRLAGGAGIGLALPGSLAIFGASEVRAAEILGDGKFPIGAWWPPPPEETNDDRYAEIAEAGFNFVIGGNGVGNDEATAAALTAASANDLRFILMDGRLRNLINGSAGARSTSSGSETESPMRLLRESEEPQRVSAASSDPEKVRERIRELVDLHGSSPALVGINLFDEPGRSLFEALRRTSLDLRELSDGLLPYVNVWPSYASPAALETSSYAKYLAQYTSIVEPPLLSFDHYPLLSGKKITRDYFFNWAKVRSRALRANIPSWVFIQSVDFDGAAVRLAPRRRPSRADLLWQINVSLAYGAKGIQYFTYWTPEGSRVPYGQALISKSGTRTPLYDYARSVNDYLQSIGQFLLPMRSVSVVHAKNRPRGATPFRPDPFVRAVGGGASILGSFVRPGGARDRYLLVVNHSPDRATRVRLSMSPRVSGVFRFNAAKGRFANPVRRRGGRAIRLPIKLGPGAAQLLLLRRR